MDVAGRTLSIHTSAAVGTDLLLLAEGRGSPGLPAAFPPHLPQEVLGSRWEVMELCGSGGGDMTSCQALMQANIWRFGPRRFLPVGRFL